jgi:hypothetical protein
MQLSLLSSAFAFPSGFNLFSSLDFWRTLENGFLLASRLQVGMFKSIAVLETTSQFSREQSTLIGTIPENDLRQPI